MKYYLDKIIVVEGKEDSAYLSSFIEGEYVTTNGYEIPSQEIDYLIAVNKYKDIIVLLDPDKAGREIENRLRNHLINATYICVDLSKCNRGKKSGVAECDKEEIIDKLKPYFIDKKPLKTPLFNENNIKFLLLNNDFKIYLSNKYHLGLANNKKMIYRLKNMMIKEEDILKSLKEFNDGN